MAAVLIAPDNIIRGCTFVLISLCFHGMTKGDIHPVAGQLDAVEYKTLVDEQDRMVERLLERVLIKNTDKWRSWLGSAWARIEIAFIQAGRESSAYVWDDHENIKAVMFSLEKSLYREIHAVKDRRQLELMKTIGRMNEIITRLALTTEPDEDEWFGFLLD